MLISPKLSVGPTSVRRNLDKKDGTVTHPEAVPDRAVFVSCDSSVASALHSAHWLAACSRWAESLIVTFPDRCLGPASRLLRESWAADEILTPPSVSSVSDDMSQPSLMLVSHEHVAPEPTHRQLPLMQELSTER